MSAAGSTPNTKKKKDSFRGERMKRSKSQKRDNNQSQENGKGTETSTLKSISQENLSNNSPSNRNPMHERLLWVLMNLVGKHVEAQVKNGEIFEGILHSVGTENGISTVLKMVRKKDPSNEKKIFTTRPIQTFIIHSNDLVQIFAKDVNFEIRDREFGTDTDISGFQGTRERQLQPWIPDNDIIPNNQDTENLDGSLNQTSWDQFEINKKLFGVETTWDEKIYTTPLDKSSPFYREKEEVASKIAAEIEGKISHNPHLMEERGKILDDSGIDEEDRYSTVFREKDELDSKKYIPPAKRSSLSKSQSEEKKSTNRKKEEKESKEKSSTAIKKDEKQKKEKPLKKEEVKAKEEKSLKKEEIEKKETSPKKEEIQLKKEETASKEEIEKKEEISSPKKGDSQIKETKSETEISKPFPKTRTEIPPLLDRVSSSERLTHTLDRANSMEDVRRTRSPSLISERLRLRLACVNEKFKNSAPVSPKITPNRSPLLSPLVGDARGINALSLDPSIPTVPDQVIQNFLDFSLSQKKKDSNQRSKTIEDLKNFSKSLDQKLGGKNPSTSPSTPSKEESKPTTPPENKNKSKLNPNAKIFKPMSVNAPVFTPSQQTAFYPPESQESQFAYRPDDVYARQMFGPQVTYPMIPGAYPRMVPPFGYFPSVMAFPPQPNQIPPSKRFPPQPKVTPQTFVPHQANTFYQYQQGNPRPYLETPGFIEGETRKEEHPNPPPPVRFQVPNTDSIPPSEKG